MTLNISIFDLWSIAHFIAGFLIGLFFLFAAQKKYRPFFCLFVFFMLILWEVVEFYFLNNLNWFFNKESFINIIGDIIAGMIGFFVGFLLIKKGL